MADDPLDLEQAVLVVARALHDLTHAVNLQAAHFQTHQQDEPAMDLGAIGKMLEQDVHAPLQAAARGHAGARAALGPGRRARAFEAATLAGGPEAARGRRELNGGRDG